MQLLSPMDLTEPEPCPYLDGRVMRLAHFFAAKVDGEELSQLLAAGWRKFGSYYFRPACPDCRACVPLRVPVKEFLHSKSQRRVWRKNRSTEVRFLAPSSRPEVYEIYRDHSITRFGKETTVREFESGFCTPSCPALQSEYCRDGVLMAVGFIDVASDALSSVYFVYRDDARALAPGVFSVLAEVEHARSLGLDYYYLGYWVADNPHMAYKNRYLPNEQMDWRSGVWRIQDLACSDPDAQHEGQNAP